MAVTLLVSKMIRRKAFHREDYIGEDDIFALVLSGGFQFDNGSGLQTVKALEGVNFRQGVRYRRHITEDACLYLFRFRCDEDILGNGKVVFQDKNRIESTLRLLQMADSLVGQDDFSCKQLLFADIVNQYRLERAGQYLNTTQRDEVVMSAISQIHENLHLKLNFKKIANDRFLSYVQFSRRFQKTTGMTPREYVTELRLKKAKQLLTESNLKIQRIADLCGFSNAYYFSNFFHKHSQMSPAQFRAINHSTEENI